MGYLREMPESISDDQLVTYIKTPGSKLTPAEAHEMAQTHPFAILGGLHRSGTTLLLPLISGCSRSIRKSSVVPLRCSPPRIANGCVWAISWASAGVSLLPGVLIYVTSWSSLIDSGISLR